MSSPYPLVDHRKNLSQGRAIPMLSAVIAGGLGLGLLGLIRLGWITAAAPIQRLESPAAILADEAHDELLRGDFSSGVQPPSPSLTFDPDLDDEGNDPSPYATALNPAAPPPPGSASLLPETRTLLGKLRRVSHFRLGSDAYVNTKSEGEQLTRLLAHQSDAIAAFDWLASQPKPIPRLYAFWALRTLAPEHARAHLEELDHDRRPVEWSHSCLRYHKAVRDIARAIANQPMPSP